jgi:hypothetical protein
MTVLIKDLVHIVLHISHLHTCYSYAESMNELSMNCHGKLDGQSWVPIHQQFRAVNRT